MVSTGGGWRSDMRATAIHIGERLFASQVVADDVVLAFGAADECSAHYRFLRGDPGPWPVQARRDPSGLCLRTSPDEAWSGPLADGAFVRLSPNGGVREPARNEGGITFVVENRGDAEVRLGAYDRGGIFDDELSMEAFRYEPQVAATYYADAYAAFVFAWMATEGLGAQYRRGAADALDFVMRTYPEYQPAKLDAFGHSDFKNPPFLEAVEEHLAGHADPAEVARWRDFFPSMVNSEVYSPTNVYALRAHWWAARNRFWAEADAEARTRPEQYLAMVLADQTAEGLIQDNIADERFFGGYTDSHDLTYHLYALSWLARAEQHLPLDELRKAIVRGARFSMALTTPGGECSYAGRSANNSYHPISAIYAFLRAAELEPTEAACFRRAARLVWGYLAGFRDARGDLPVGLNDHADQRMGWSHAQTPYSASNAYFLIRSLPLAGDDDAPGADDALHAGDGAVGGGRGVATGGPALLPLEGTGVLDLSGSRYAGLSNDRAHLVVFAGCDCSPYPHSGLHNTGVAGIAVLGSPASSSLLPILEQSLREGDWSTSDLPDIEQADGSVAAPIGRGTMVVEDGTTMAAGIPATSTDATSTAGGATSTVAAVSTAGGDAGEGQRAASVGISLRYGGFEVHQTYRLDGATVHLTSVLRCIESGDYRVVGLPGISVRTDVGCRTRLDGRRVHHAGPTGAFTLQVDEPSLSASRGDVGGWVVEDPSSTGRGMHRKVGRVLAGRFEAGDEHRVSWRLEVLDHLDVVDNLPEAPALPAPDAEGAAGIAEVVLRKLYRKHSLRRTGGGLSFVVRNSLVDVHLGGITRMEIDGRAVPGGVSLRYGDRTVEATDLSTETPLHFRKGHTAEVHVEDVDVAPGPHTLGLGLWINEVGPVDIDVRDVLPAEPQRTA